MTYALLLFALLVFVLGLKGSTELVSLLRDVQQRRNLLARIAGFLLMSAWLHALPSLLVIVYMRREGLLASELLAHDESRATVISLFTLPIVVTLTLIASWGGLRSFMTSTSWRATSKDTIVGFAMLITACVSIAWQIKSIEQGLFLFFLVAPLSVYISLALGTPLSQQIRLYWAPFAVVLVVSIVLILASARTHEMVADELRRFGIGGGVWVVAKYKEDTIEGKLLLVTDRTAFIREMLDYKTPSDCIVRLPIDESLLATTIGTPFSRQFQALSPRQREAAVRVLSLPDLTSSLADRGRSARESTRKLCRGDFEAKTWSDLRDHSDFTKLSFCRQTGILLADMDGFPGLAPWKWFCQAIEKSPGAEAVPPSPKGPTEAAK